MADGGALLAIEGLSVSFATERGDMEVVDTVSLSVGRGRTLALVGESGCGKSVTAASVMRLLPLPYGKVTKGRILFKGEDLLAKDVREMYRIRGGSVAMIFQEPMTALNPVHDARSQIEEVLELHRPEIPKDARREAVLGLLRSVEMPSPEERLGSYPFQLSGGMRQRVMIAMALAGEPELLIADEPTTALDVTVQAQILKLIRDLQARTGMGMLYITHDMGVVAELADEVAVMYAGQVIETGSAAEIFASPAHPYTKGLIASMPSLGSEPKSRLPAIPGIVPSPRDYPPACRFAERCPLADPGCRAAAPPLEGFGKLRSVRCFKADKR